MTRSRTIKTMAAGLLVLALAGCQAPPVVDKTGSAVTVLRLATFDSMNNNGQQFGPLAFVDNLQSVSGGKLRVEVMEQYGGGEANAESDLVKAIASGDIDGGWPATRAFSAAGIKGLEVVEAPMTITSYATEKAVATSPVATALLGSLDGSGVVGLGLSVGPLRRPFAAKAPLLGPEDWKGISFRSYNSPVQAAAIKALGATPVNRGLDWIDAVQDGTLRGAEFDVAQYGRSNLGKAAGHVTSNVVLWPKMFVLSLIQKRFDTLTPEQRSWVREAASRAVQASVAATYDESTVAKELCGDGVTFHRASPAQIAALHNAFRSVEQQLAAHPAPRRLLSQIRGLAVQDTPPESLPADVCVAAGDSESAKVPTIKIPTTVSALPAGVYRQRITAQDLAAAGMTNDEGLSGTWTLTVRPGQYDVSCQPLNQPGIDCGHEVSNKPLDVGDLRGSGHIVYFVPDVNRLSKVSGCQLPAGSLPNHCTDLPPARVSWTVDGDTLTLSDPNDDEGHDPRRSWRRIG
jgi:TRAP-type C4-dicarboxylate transport system substrate-binding protein